MSDDMDENAVTGMLAEYRTLSEQKLCLEHQISKVKVALESAAKGVEMHSKYLDWYESESVSDAVPEYPSRDEVVALVSELKAAYQKLVPLASRLEKITGGKFAVD